MEWNKNIIERCTSHIFKKDFEAIFKYNFSNCYQFQMIKCMIFITIREFQRINYFLQVDLLQSISRGPHQGRIFTFHLTFFEKLKLIKRESKIKNKFFSIEFDHFLSIIFIVFFLFPSPFSNDRITIMKETFSFIRSYIHFLEYPSSRRGSGVSCS